MKTACSIFSPLLFLLILVMQGVPAFAKVQDAANIPSESPQQRIDRIGAELVRFNSASHVKEYTFYLDDDSDETNAWADEDGEIEMTIKMYDMFKHSDGELAFFLAHELAHVNLDHYEGKENLANALEFLSGHSKENKEQLKLAFERQQEASADKYGILYLVRSGYSAMAAVRGFLTLKKYGYDFTPHKEKRTRHPTTSNRIELALKMVQEISEAISQYEYGLMYLAQGKYGEAEECLLEFLEVFPASKEGNTNLGICYAHLATAAIAPPEYLYEFSVAKLDTGHFLKSLGILALDPNYTAAEKAFTDALEVDSGYGEALNNLGLLYTIAGDTEKGLAHLRRAALTDTENVLYANNLGFAAAMAGQVEESRQAFTRASQEKDFLLGQYNMGRLLWKDGNKEQARAYLTRYLASAQDGEGTAKEKAAEMLGTADQQENVAEEVKPVARQQEMALAGVSVGSSREKLMAMHGNPEKVIQLNDGKAEVWHYLDGKLSIVMTNNAAGDKAVQQITAAAHSQVVAQAGPGKLIHDPASRVLQLYGQPALKLHEGPYEIWSYRDLGVGFFVAEDKVEKVFIAKTADSVKD